MPLQVDRIIAEVRRLSQDKGAGQAQRHTDGDIRGALGLAVSDIRRARPDYLYGTLPSGNMPDATTADSLDLPAYLLTPLVMVTTGYLLLQTDEYSDDGTAQNLVALGRQQLGGTP